MFSRVKKFFSYYKPYKRLLLADLFCALLLTATTLSLPVCTRSITKHLQDGLTPSSTEYMIMIGAIMVMLLVIHVCCRMFVDYQGHMMGAFMERDMRWELFEHFQKLSFSFYDQQRTGELLTRITTDTLEISELYHHGPEEIAIAFLTFVGAFAIMLGINVELALVVFSFLPIMIAYTVFFNKRMAKALRRSKDCIGNINTQVEDTLGGIRVVKSFTNDAVEKRKFASLNQQFVDSRRDAYRSEGYFFAGMTGFTQLIPLVVILFAATRIGHGRLDFADLIAFLMFVTILVDPIHRFIVSLPKRKFSEKKLIRKHPWQESLRLT